ncbi:hypothetical protein AcW1_003365 [Taiwanofungus camphoratus]|nr:hypothetical protein AcV5_002165 [Antrodia cinnamomea]KAI0941487.1 hypothetical protein AcW1_003365 [Antrodia cinnamomea]
MSAITGYDVWGTVAGILGTLGLIPILSSIINDQLPSTKLRILDETFFDTECLLRSVSEEGLFLNSNFIAEKEGRLLGIHRQAEEYRTATYCATTFVKQLKVMMKGLSKKISLLCVEVKEVRASISSTSAKQRERLRAEGLLPTSGNAAIPSFSVSSAQTAPVERPFCPGAFTSHALGASTCGEPCTANTSALLTATKSSDHCHAGCGIANGYRARSLLAAPLSSSSGCYPCTVTAVPSGLVPAQRTMSSQRIQPDARRMMPSSSVRTVMPPLTFFRKPRMKFSGRTRHRLYRRNHYRLCRYHPSPPQSLRSEHSETQTLGLSHHAHSPSDRMRHSTETTIDSVMDQGIHMKVLDGAKDDNDWEDADECDIETDIPQLLYSAPEIPVLDDRHSVEVQRYSR